MRMRDPRNFEFILIISSFPRIPIISHRDRLRDITASKQLVAYKNLHTWTSHNTFPIPITITDATHEYSNAHFAETRHENRRQVDTFPREISTHVIRTHLLRLQFACAKLANKTQNHAITNRVPAYEASNSHISWVDSGKKAARGRKNCERETAVFSKPSRKIIDRRGINAE